MPKIEIPEGDSVDTVLTEQEIAEAEANAEEMKGIDFTDEEKAELLEATNGRSEVVKYLDIRGMHLRLTNEVLHKLKTLTYKLTKQEKDMLIQTVWEMIAPEENPPQEEGFPLANLEGLLPEEQQWLYQDIVPRGQFCLLAAEPGVGKTSLSTYLTIQMYKSNPDIRIGFLSFEDDAQQFVNKGINYTYSDRVFLYTTDSIWSSGKGMNIEDPLLACKRVLSFIFRHNLDVVFIDTIQKLLNVDANRYDVVSECLVPMVKVCAMIGCNITCITHFNKGSAKVKDKVNLASLVMGSQAWNGTVRNALAIWADRKSGIRALEVIKSNVGALGKSWDIKSCDGIVTGLEFKGQDYATNLASGTLNRKITIPECITTALAIFGRTGQPFTVAQFQEKCGSRQAFYRWVSKGYGDIVKVNPEDYPNFEMGTAKDLYKFADEVNNERDIYRLARNGQLEDELADIDNKFHEFENKIMAQFGTERFTIDQLKEFGLFETWQDWVKDSANKSKFEKMPTAKRLYNRPTFRLVLAEFHQQLRLMGIRKDEETNKKGDE